MLWFRMEDVLVKGLTLQPHTPAALGWLLGQATQTELPERVGKAEDMKQSRETAFILPLRALCMGTIAWAAWVAWVNCRMPHLGPCEDPGDGTQGLNTPRLGTCSGPAANVQAAQLTAIRAGVRNGGGRAQKDREGRSRRHHDFMASRHLSLPATKWFLAYSASDLAP